MTVVELEKVVEKLDFLIAWREVRNFNDPESIHIVLVPLWRSDRQSRVGRHWYTP